MKIVIIGAGNVGTNLEAAFRRAKLDVTLVSSREAESLRGRDDSCSCTIDNLPPSADVYFYTVADNAIQDIMNKVHVHPRAMHLITSGTLSLSVFGSDKPHCGIFYPFMTFSKTRILEDFSNVPIFIEAKNIDDTAAVYSLALTLTSHVYEASQAAREKLHVAGVFVNNFTNSLYGCAQDILRGTGIPFTCLLPLIDETAAKVHDLSPKDAQTGPAKRGDEAVMEHHLSLLHPEEQEIYQLLSNKIKKQQSL